MYKCSNEGVVKIVQWLKQLLVIENVQGWEGVQKGKIKIRIHRVFLCIEYVQGWEGVQRGKIKIRIHRVFCAKILKVAFLSLLTKKTC